MLIFISHGAPSIAIEKDQFTDAIERFGAQLSPTAVVIVSAHWQTRGGVRVNAVERPEMIYDFGGFARELYSIRYDAPGSPKLAREVAGLLGAELELKRGWDHGLWVPLRRLFPDADLPIVEVSLPHPAEPEELLAMGRALAPLRDRDILIAASGGVVHNLSLINLSSKDLPALPWAQEFDSWVASRLEARDVEAIANYREQGPQAALAVPTPEHFEPLIVLLGAVRPDDRLIPIHDSLQYGSLSMRSFAFVGNARRGSDVG